MSHIHRLQARCWPCPPSSQPVIIGARSSPGGDNPPVQEDVITALRNYSKNQTTKRLAAAGAGARRPPVQRPPRRSAPAPGEAAPAARPRLSINVRRKTKAAGEDV